MNSKLSGILFLLCIPLSIALFLFVSSATQSEILGLLSAVLLYMLAGVLISLLCLVLAAVIVLVGNTYD